MSTSSITGAAVRDLAATIHRQLDTDRDGKLSSIEFESFLSQLVGAVQNSSSPFSGSAAISRVSLWPAPSFLRLRCKDVRPALTPLGAERIS